MLLAQTLSAAALLVADAAVYTGPQACAECHPKQYEQQKSTHHAQALRRIGESREVFPLAPMTERGGASFQYEVEGAALRLITRKSNDVYRTILEWTFGAGSQAYTAVGRLADGRYFEHRISYYTKPRRLALTPGHSSAPSLDAEAAAGIVQAPETIYRCFHCHAANVKPGPDISAMIPGVTCERCHGPGAKHIEAAKAKQDLKGTIFNAGRLTAKAIVPVCAECHRFPNVEYRSEMPEVEDPLSIRFAPVGLSASRCFQKSTTLSCISCHNPHENPKPAADPSYTQVCVGCHSPEARPAKPVCKAKQTANCVSCHMKASSPVPNLTFTDHRIRTYFF
jgi:predicted CXXCH cytochrome family protein